MRIGQHSAPNNKLHTHATPTSDRQAYGLTDSNTARSYPAHMPVSRWCRADTDTDCNTHLLERRSERCTAEQPAFDRTLPHMTQHPSRRRDNIRQGLFSPTIDERTISTLRLLLCWTRVLFDVLFLCSGVYVRMYGNRSMDLTSPETAAECVDAISPS